MESKAHYALIGTFVILALFGFLGFIAWWSNAEFDQQYDEYEVVFSGAVRGLSQGSEVRFNGLRVGEVTGLRLDPSNSNSVISDIQVNSNTPVDSKSFARLEPLGLTGLNYIQIFAGGEEYPLLKDMPGKGPYRIAGQMSQIDSFLDEGGSVIEGASRALNRVNATLSEDAIMDFQAILANLRTLSDNIKDTEVNPKTVEDVLRAIETAAQDVSIAAKAFDTAATGFDDMIQKDVTSVTARMEASLAQLDETLVKFGKTADETTNLSVDARDAINRLSNSGVADLEETTDAIRRLVLTLNRVADELERGPAQFLVGEERETIELPQ